MTEEDDNIAKRQLVLEKVRLRAMKAWSDKIFDADHAWIQELLVASKELGVSDLSPEEAASTHERTVLDLTRWFGDMFQYRTNLDLDRQTIEHLERLEEAQYKTGIGPQTGLACRIIGEHGEWYQARLKGTEYPRGNTPEEIVWFLIVSLELGVNPCFERLENHRDTVASLLSRFEPDSKKRGNYKGRSHSDGTTLIDANGIFRELFALCGFTIAPSQVSRAIKKDKAPVTK